MAVIRAAAAIALLLAVFPALASRNAEWWVDPRTGLDQKEVASMLEEVLSARDTNIPMEMPFRIRIEIGVSKTDQTFDLLITSTDLDANLPLQSVVRADPSVILEPVISALVADLGYLHAAHFGFPSPIYLPPDITDIIEGQAIADLIRTVNEAVSKTKIEPEPGNQILDLAAHDRGVSILLTGGAVELGPRFELTTATPSSLLPPPLPSTATIPHEIARTSWTHDMLTVEFDRAQILRRRSGESSFTSHDLTVGARRLDGVPGGGLVALIRSKEEFFERLSYLRLTDHAIEERRIPVAAPFITAMDVDHQRRMVLYDPFDRRVVITGLDGREISSIRPQVDPRMLPFPHALAVLSDGSILLGGSSLVLAFDQLGRQQWLLVAPHEGRETLPTQFVLEPATDGDAFYLLDGPRTRILRFNSSPSRKSGKPLIDLGEDMGARNLANLALVGAISAQEWGDLTETVESANLAIKLYEHALKITPDDKEIALGLERAIKTYSDAESIIFQEPFLSLSPDHLVITAAAVIGPTKFLIQVENTGVVNLAGVSLMVAGLRVPIGHIEPGKKVNRLIMVDLPESLLATHESISLDVGVVVSADDPSSVVPRMMFVEVPLQVTAPPWEQVVAGESASQG